MRIDMQYAQRQAILAITLPFRLRTQQIHCYQIPLPTLSALLRCLGSTILLPCFDSAPATRYTMPDLRPLTLRVTIMDSDNDSQSDDSDVGDDAPPHDNGDIPADVCILLFLSPSVFLMK
jgi:hypothetical protein